MTLLEHHRAKCRASGLTEATIAAAGMYSETSPDKLAALLGSKRKERKLAPAIVFPYVGADGSNGYARIRPDNKVLRGGKPAKYLSPTGKPNQVYLPPGVAAVLPDASRELLLTEGELKALKATQEGFPCIGLVGVMGWKPKGRAALLPELEAIAWKGRAVYIAFDSDIAVKSEVQEAESQLAAHLKNRGAKVRVVRLPDGPPGADGKPTKNGLDDFLAAAGPDAARELRKRLDAAEDPAPPDPASIKLEPKMLDATREGPAFLQRTEKDGVFRLRHWRGAWWYWAGGCYRELPASEVRAKVTEHLLQRFFGFGGRHVSDCLDIARSVANLPHHTEPPAWIGPKLGPWPAGEILVARNGLVHLPALLAGKPEYMRPATPALFALSALDFDFALDAPRPDAWLGFLSELWPADNESIETLQDWFGYCLTPDTRQQKILMIVGPKRSGKGTIARVLRATIGAENVAGPTLASLATNFGLWPLLGKSLAIVSDARLSGRTDSAIVVERLLSVSGEDALTIDRKNLEPVTCKLPTRLMLLSNELPRLGDSSGALAGRMIILRLTESFYGREDHKLTDRLLAELPSILWWAIAGWQRLQDRGRFIQPAAADELRGELEDLASPVGAFLRECCHVGPEYKVSRAALYEAYVAWAKDRGKHHPEDEATFGRNLRAVLPTLRDSQPRIDGRQVRHHVGVGLQAWE